MTKETNNKRPLSLDSIFMGTEEEQDDQTVALSAEEMRSAQNRENEEESRASVSVTEKAEAETAIKADMEEEAPVVAEEEAPVVAEEEAPVAAEDIRRIRRYIKDHVSDQTRQKLERDERTLRNELSFEAMQEEAPIPTGSYSDFIRDDEGEPEPPSEDTEDLTKVLPTLTTEEELSETRVFPKVKSNETTWDAEALPIHRASKESNRRLTNEEKKETSSVQKPAYSDEDAEEERKNKGLRGFFYNWILPVAIAIVLAIIIRFFIGGATTVSGTSMEPTLNNGDFLLVSKIPTYFKKYHRGDILIIDSPDLDEYYVKRLIGLPGETVEIKDGKVYINGKWMKEYYTSEDTASYANTKWKLGNNEYFVMGDNRASGASNDSRLFGPIPAEHIKAVSRFRIWPITKFMSMY